MNISNHLLILLGLLFFMMGVVTGQEFLTESNFNEKTAKDIVAVEFWVEWNSSNEFVDLSKLDDCAKYRVDVGKYPDIQSEFNITSLPTVIIFESGEEKERFKANIMFQLDADKKEIQSRIDDIMLAKFN
jgi:thioredoxin-like negative regulator of GroEL